MADQDLVKLEGFLFDMNRFFQTLLSRFMNDYLTDHQVQDEFKLHGMMEYQAGKNPQNHPSPSTRPDFAIFKGNTMVRILDAKYRNLWENKLTRDMLYQLSIYALSQKPGPKSEAAILYPTLDRAAREATIVIKDSVTTKPRGKVTLRPVNLDFLDELLGNREMHGARSKASDYAHQLAFGLR